MSLWLPSGSLGSFRSVLGPTLLAVLDTTGVQRPTHDVVSNARQIFDTATPHQHHRMLLQIVAFAWDVGGYFHAVGQSNTRNLAQS